VVFIAGVEERLLPLPPRSLADPLLRTAHLEEERRLLYVGMTRAVATLYLTWCQARAQREGKNTLGQPSRFLEELPPALFSPPPIFRAAITKRNAAHRQLSLFS
jgi:superfamily I DNA/RNA helicase